jgi:hypothetical protein
VLTSRFTCYWLKFEFGFNAGGLHESHRVIASPIASQATI